MTTVTVDFIDAMDELMREIAAYFECVAIARGES